MPTRLNHVGALDKIYYPINGWIVYLADSLPPDSLPRR